jgi:hypothetical protein
MHHVLSAGFGIRVSLPAYLILQISVAQATTVQINFVNLTPISIECGTPSGSPCASPTFEAVDTSQPDLGVGHALADVPAGTLKAKLTAAPPSATTGGSYSVRVAVTDLFTLTGPTLPVQILIYPTLKVTGSGVAPFADTDTPEPGGQSFGDVRAFVGSGGFDIFSFSTNPLSPPSCCTVAPDVPFPISISAEDVGFSATVGVPFRLQYGIVLNGANGTDLDVMATAKLSFIFSEGYAIQSSGGYVQSAAAVPEPSGFTLTSLGVIAFFFAGKRFSAVCSKNHTI